MNGNSMSPPAIPALMDPFAPPPQSAPPPPPPPPPRRCVLYGCNTYTPSGGDSTSSDDMSMVIALSVLLLSYPVYVLILKLLMRYRPCQRRAHSSSAAKPPVLTTVEVDTSVHRGLWVVTMDKGVCIVYNPSQQPNPELSQSA